MNSFNCQNHFRKTFIVESNENNNELKFRKSFNARLSNSSNDSHSKRIPGHDMLHFE